jgi:hypothetical protein
MIVLLVQFVDKLRPNPLALPAKRFAKKVHFLATAHRGFEPGIAGGPGI